MRGAAGLAADRLRAHGAGELVPHARTAPLLLAAISALGCAAESGLPWPDGAALIQDPALDEMSGLEASPSRAGEFWSINDSGSVARLYRLAADGRALGRVSIGGAWLHDTETLAVWRDVDRGRDWLLIGDVGDNRGWRREVRVHAVVEPQPGDRHARIAWTLRFRYPDGPRDAEGIAVDHREGTLLVLSKRDRPARLYRVPLPTGGSSEPVLAEWVATLPAHVVDGEVTGLDLSSDGRTLAVLSYRGLYLWRRDEGVGWRAALAVAPLELPVPRLRKAEALAFSRDHDAIFIGSERRPTPLLRIELPSPPG